MQSNANTVEEYLASLPEDRRHALAALRKVILDHIDPEFSEHMAYGMIGYAVPHARYPAGYHCNPKQPLPFAGLASQKQYMSLYLCAAYAGSDAGAESRWLREAWAASGKKLDMGKGCVRFRKLEDLPLDVVAAFFRRMTAERFIAGYEAARAAYRPTPRAEIRARSAAKPKAGRA